VCLKSSRCQAKHAYPDCQPSSAHPSAPCRSPARRQIHQPRSRMCFTYPRVHALPKSGPAGVPQVKEMSGTLPAKHPSAQLPLPRDAHSLAIE
jgi:hypothetical protein